MIRINYLVEELVDDVFIRGIDLSQPFKPMTNNELTIEELQGIAGGAKKTTKLMAGDPNLSISDEPAFTPKQKVSGDPKLSISDEPAFTPKQVGLW